MKVTWLSAAAYQCLLQNQLLLSARGQKAAWNNNFCNEGERKIFHNSPPPVMLIMSEWGLRLYF